MANSLLPGAFGAAGLFSPPHTDSGLDTDGDGLFNFLVVNASINVTDAGPFLVDATLYDPTFTLSLFTSNVTPLDVGLQTVPLWFDGVPVNVSGVDGQYTVDLRLFEHATLTLLDTDTHTTGAYSHLDFEEPPAALAPPHSDSGLDTDGDGLFNFLVVNAHIDVSETGVFLVEAALHDSAPPLNLFTSNVTTLDVGLQMVPLLFDGLPIKLSGADGPYTVELFMYEYTTFTFLGADTHNTTAYAHLDFDDLTADVSPPVLSIDLPTSGAFLATGDVAVQWTATDAGSGIDRFEVALDGDAPAVLPSTTTSQTFTGLADGSHSVTVTAFDNAGNPQAATVDFVVDTVQPSLSIDSPTEGSLLAVSNVQVIWTASDVVSGIDHFEASLDGGAAMTLPATATNHVFSDIGDGPHKITVTAVDRAANSAAASVDVTVDTNPFSPTGPFGILLLVALPAAIAAVAVAVFLFFWFRKRAARPPP